MSFDTYVINLKKDTHKYEKLSKALNSAGISHKRFDAIYGKEVGNEYDEYLHKYKQFIPKACLGCGLSHYLVAKKHFEKDNQKVAFIFEDDASLKFKNQADINNIIKQAPEDWDIILLYTQGVTNYKKNTWDSGPIAGSCISYLINKKGFDKLYKDFQLLLLPDVHRIIQTKQNKDLKVYKTPSIMVLPDESNISSTSTTNSRYFDNLLNSFYSDVLESELTGFTASMAVKYKLLRLPFFDYELDYVQLFIVIAVLNILIFTIMGRKKVHSFLFSSFYYIVLFISIVIFLKYYLLLIT